MPSAPYSPLYNSHEPPLYPLQRTSWFPSWRIHRSRSDRLKSLGFYGAAIITGLTLHLILAGSYIIEPYRGSTVRTLFPIDSDSAVENSHARSSGAYIRPALGQLASPGEMRDLEDLRAMVSRTKGYFTRDYSVWLGWNNVGLATVLHV